MEIMETSIKGAKGVLINITTNSNTGLDEATYASEIVTQEADPDANIIWGVTYDDDLDDEMKITIIATGFEKTQGDASAVTKPAEEPAAKEETPKAPVKPAPAPRKPTREVISDEDFNNLGW